MGGVVADIRPFVLGEILFLESTSRRADLADILRDCQ